LSELSWRWGLNGRAPSSNHRLKGPARLFEYLAARHTAAAAAAAQRNIAPRGICGASRRAMNGLLFGRQWAANLALVGHNITK